MSPPVHLMLRGLPQRVASLELAWHTARRQRDIHAAECLRAAQCCQPARANAMAWPPAHVLATSQRDRSPLLGWLCRRRSRAGVKDGFGSYPPLVPKPRQEAGRRVALSMSVIRGLAVRSCAAIPAFPPRDNRATPTGATLNAGVGEQAGRRCAISPCSGPVYKPPPRSQMSALCVISCFTTRASRKTRIPTLIESCIQSGDLFRMFPFSCTMKRFLHL